MIQKQCVNNGVEASALFSDDMKYRYVLTRCWDDSPWINFIMLNPSTGDEKQLENTTKGVMKRAKAWGYGGIMVVNAYSLISTNPAQLTRVDDPVGPSGDWAIDYLMKFVKKNDEMVVCAWGRHGKPRQNSILDITGDYPLHVLGVNADGTPRHPLHMSHSIEPEIWDAEKRVDY